MKKENTLNSAKKTLRSTTEKIINSTEETAESARKIASDVVTKGNVQKTLDALKNTAKNVKAKATKATTSAKKRADKKNDVAFYVQYQGKEFCKQTILDKVNEEWSKFHKLSEIKTVEVYLKVEEATAYCLINGKININLKLF